MARRSQARALACIAYFALTLTQGAAQTLPRLHVPSFSMHADTLHPQIEKPFHLVIDAHFKEQLSSADFIVLPVLVELENLGDERQTIAAAQGTDFRETLTVVAHRSGELHVAPAYFDAIDARDGKPKRFSSNDLLLHVEGGPLEDPFSGIRHALVTIVQMLAILVAVFVVATIFFRRRAGQVVAAAPQPPIVLPVAVPVRTPKEILREQLAALRINPTREGVMRARKALWAMAGASEGETLGDVLAKLRGRSPELYPLLRLTERAAFIADSHLQGAIEDMILAFEGHLA